MKKILIIIFCLFSLNISAQFEGTFFEYGNKRTARGFNLDTTVVMQIYNALGKTGIRHYARNDTFLVQFDTLGYYNFMFEDDTLTFRDSNDTIYLENPNGVIKVEDLVGGGYWSKSGNYVYLNGGESVGIGTALPIYELDVSGDIRATGNIYANDTLNIGGSTYIDANLYVESPSGTAAVINRKTTLTGGLRNVLDYQLSSSNDMVDGFGAAMRFMIRDNATIKTIAKFGAVRNGADAQGAIVFNTGDNGATEQMRIDYYGNVGIGDATPSYELDVNGDINFTGDLYTSGTLFQEGLFTQGSGVISPTTTTNSINISSDDSYRIGGNSVLYITGGTSTHVGIGSGTGSGAGNTSIGYFSGRVVTTGTENTFSGAYSGETTITGLRNVAIGYQAGNTIGTAASDTGNSLLGYRAGRLIDGGNFNTCFGHYSGSGITTGDYNTCFGNNTGKTIASSSYNVFIGYGSGKWETTSNKLMISNQPYLNESNARDSSLIYGDFATDQLTINGGQLGSITTVSEATYDLQTSDYILHVTYTATGAVTSLTLPTAQTVEGRIIIIKDTGNAGTNSIVIDTEGAQTIDGDSDWTINGDYDWLELYCDGTNWFIID